MQIKKHIPNIITLLNLFCGCIAVVFAAELNFEMAFYFCVFGYFSGFFRWIFGQVVQGGRRIGFAIGFFGEMATSGVVPGYVMYWLLQESRKSRCLHFDFAVFGFHHHLGVLLPFGQFQYRYPSNRFFHRFANTCQCLVYIEFALGFEIFQFLGCFRYFDQSMDFVGHHFIQRLHS